MSSHLWDWKTRPQKGDKKSKFPLSRDGRETLSLRSRRDWHVSLKTHEFVGFKTWPRR